MTPRAVIFDLFGTLVPTYTAQNTNRKIAATLGVSEASYEEVLAASAEDRYRGKFCTVEAMFEHSFVLLGLAYDKRLLDEIVAYRLEATRLNLRPRADAVRTLKRLKQAGFKLGLLSDSSPDVPPLYAETPFAKGVDASIFSCLVKLKKPDPDVYNLVCKELGVIPEQYVYVGDGGSRELSGARAVGMRPILLRVPKGETVQPEAKAWRGGAVDLLGELTFRY